ncbi:Acetyltransferase (GNAT) family protein [compost metagenome]
MYVSNEHRGCGAGKALLRHLARVACDSGCGRFEWSVLDWNTPAIDFYDSIGALPQAQWLRYRMDGDALRRFAYWD